MNGAQQVERFTAVRRAEKRLDDIETLLPALAQEVVTDRRAREELTTDMHGLGTAILEERTEREQVAADLHGRLHALRVQVIDLRSFTQMTLWQRLRWIVRGV